MSAAYAPDPDDRRDRPSGDELSERDRRVLDEIAGHENGADPAFTARLRQPAPKASPATERMLQFLAVAAVAAVLLPTEWLMVGVILTVLVVMPGLLAWYGRRATPPTARQTPED
jgi:Flp pilus assembly protein TadB